jgi:HK97 family phage portal protein
MIGRVLAGGTEERGRVIGDDDDLEILTDGRGPGAVGANERTAMLVPPLFAGVRIISQAVAMTPLNVIRQRADGTREVALEERLGWMLGVSANAEHDAGSVWEFVVASLLLRGNAYLWRERDGAGRVVGLWPIRPDRVQVQRDQKTKRKVFLLSSSSDDAVQYIGTTFDILHIRGLGFDGLQGWSIIRQLADLLDRSHSEARYQLKMLKNGVRPSGILKAPSSLTDEASKKMKRRWQGAYGGIDNAGGTPVLEEGLEWQSISLSAADAQLLEQRRFTREEWAMVLSLPAQMLHAGQGSGMHYDSAAMDMTYFAQISVAPHCSRITRALHHDAELPWNYTPGAPGARLFPKFDLDALSEADPTTRFENYKLARDGRWMTQNEPRRREGMPALDGGDVLPPDRKPGEAPTPRETA